MAELSNKDKVLNFAARIDQIDLELQAIWKDRGESFSASHQAGVVLYSLRTVSMGLQKLAGMLKGVC